MVEHLGGADRLDIPGGMRRAGGGASCDQRTRAHDGASCHQRARAHDRSGNDRCCGANHDTERRR